MLGFSALSAAPLSVSIRNSIAVGTGSPIINAVVNSIVAQGSNNSAANSVSATLSTGTLNTNLVANILTSAATSSTTANTPSINLTASKTITAATATFGISPLEFPADDILLDTISLAAGITALDFNAKASTTTSGFSISTTLVDVTPFLEIDVSQLLVGLGSTFSLNLATPANNLFDYDAHADDYARTRTVYILPEEGYGLSKVAHINAENFTLVIDAHKDISNTVLITR